MTENTQRQLGSTLWSIAEELRGAMNADDFRDYMLALLFLRYLSDNYERAAKKELGTEYPSGENLHGGSPICVWYEQNPTYQSAFEKQMRSKSHYVIRPEYLWDNIAYLARTQNDTLLTKLQEGFKHIETESFESTFSGLFSEINLRSDKLGKNYSERNAKLCIIITKIAEGLAKFSTEIDRLGDAYEYLIGQFAAGSGRRAGEFYTPQRISDILSEIVTLDSHDPKNGQRRFLASVMDFACGSGSLLLNVRKHLGARGIGRMYGQEKNITTYNLARMNMLLHGMKDTEFQIYHGDTLTNDWGMLRESNPSKKPYFDAIVANPPFSYRWNPNEAMAEDMRFRNHGLAPKSAADFSFLLHGFHYLKDNGVMAIILPHGALFRGGSEAKIRRKLIDDGNIDTIIGMPGHLFYSTGIPVCIVVLKKCKQTDDILFINASEHYIKGRGQNYLSEAHIEKIINTYKERPDRLDRYARRVGLDEIIEQDYNLNIARYVSTAVPQVEVDLVANHKALMEVERKIEESTESHSIFLHELGLPSLN